MSNKMSEADQKQTEELAQQVNKLVAGRPLWMITIALGTVLGNMLATAPTEDDVNSFVEDVVDSIKEQARAARRRASES
jgi:hypothetical protein